MQIFELVKKLELDTDFNGDTYRIQLELYRHASTKRKFRCRLWRIDFYRSQPSFPQDKKGKPRHPETDEAFLVNWDFLLSKDHSLFEASSIENALQIVMRDLEANLNQPNRKK